MDRYGSPSLFITVNGLDGNAKELRHLALSFFQFFSELLKFLAVHTQSLIAEYAVVLNLRGLNSISHYTADTITMWYFVSRVF